MGELLQFPQRSPTWMRQERQALIEIRRALTERGFDCGTIDGVSDQREPWTIFYSVSRGSFVAQVTRHKSGYVLLWRDRSALKAAELYGLIDQVRAGDPAHAGFILGDNWPVNLPAIVGDF